MTHVVKVSAIGVTMAERDGDTDGGVGVVTTGGAKDGVLAILTVE